MATELKLEIIRDIHLTDEQRSAIHVLCNRAYEEDLTSLFNTFSDTTHVLGYLEETIVSHAMWVTRWLQPGDGPYLRTAYVEMVATEPNFQRRGFATVIMRGLAEAISDFELGGLCPAEPELYAKLGWVFWRGPLFIRAPGGLMPTPDEEVMILRLSKTPVLDLDLPLSAEWRGGEIW
jgi:aminoglycoside 2'-N-acetyltransferase I